MACAARTPPPAERQRAHGSQPLIETCLSWSWVSTHTALHEHIMCAAHSHTRRAEPNTVLTVREFPEHGTLPPVPLSPMRGHTPRLLHACDSPHNTLAHPRISTPRSQTCGYTRASSANTVRLWLLRAAKPPGVRSVIVPTGRGTLTRPRSGCRQSSRADGRSWQCPGRQTG